MVRRLGSAGMAAACVGCGGLAVGCGDDPPSQPEPEAEERADPRGKLPPRWKRVVNASAGFSLGIPPGWTARGARGATLVRSGDRLLAVSISADRSPEGRTLAPAVYARRTMRSLAGYRNLEVGRPVRARGTRYRGASVGATGVFVRTRVRQVIRVFALQRRGQVTYTLSFFRTARSPGPLYNPAIRGMVRTFRAQPPRG